MSRSFGGTSFTTRPSIDIVPPEISSRPAIIRSVVDFPQPEGPTRTTNSLSLTFRLKSSTATNPSSVKIFFTCSRVTSAINTPLGCRFPEIADIQRMSVHCRRPMWKSQFHPEDSGVRVQGSGLFAPFRGCVCFFLCREPCRELCRTLATYPSLIVILKSNFQDYRASCKTPRETVGTPACRVRDADREPDPPEYAAASAMEGRPPCRLRVLQKAL